MDDRTKWIIEPDHKLTDQERFVGSINGQLFEIPTQLKVVSDTSTVIEYWVSQATLIDSPVPMTDEQREAIREKSIEWCAGDPELVVK